MRYVTQGTVQLERDGTTAKIFISPTSDYAVRHRENDYVVFVSESPSSRPQSRLLDKKAGSLTIDVKKKELIEVLTEAAFERTVVEIIGNAKCTDVEAVKVPARS